MRVLVTGGCGFVGSNLAASALERGCEVVLFDNLSRHGAARNLEWLHGLGALRFVHGDIRNHGDVDRVLSDFKPTIVFHLCGQVAMTTSLERPLDDFHVNALGTLHLLEAVRNRVPDAIVVYGSTNKVYGDLQWLTYSDGEYRYLVNEYPEGFDESLALDFHSPYGCSKGAADQYCLDYSRMYGLRTVVFRHSSMYGGRQFPTFDQGWVGWFALQALRQKADPSVEPFTIAGSGKQVRDVLHSADVVRAYWAAVDHIHQAAGQAFVIGGGLKNSLSLLELFSLLEGILGIRVRYSKTEPRASDQLFFVASNRKARDLLAWTPHQPAREGIRDLVTWLRAEVAP